MSFLYYWSTKKPFPVDGGKEIMHAAIKQFELHTPNMKNVLKNLSGKKTTLDEILTVRDPLYRFLASWRYKIETPSYSTYRKRTRRDSFFYYQKITTPVLKWKKLNYKKNQGEFEEEKKKNPMFGLSFCDYVDYYGLFNGKAGTKIDFHLHEQWHNCGVCNENYKAKFIGNTETYDEDLWWLFTKYGLKPPGKEYHSKFERNHIQIPGYMMAQARPGPVQGFFGPSSF